ncbi:DUF943 family protein [Enterobacter hormaechei]|uniref:DUF943 family protein n=1 Tax=Enterobacter hormaechei TaxID=158836 RepID=UPI0032B0AE1F|nr:DUF943 family protein [Enterobacter hormaechei]HDC4377880.1 DUF943 family protein [Enterobacter hormaechei]
MRFLIYLKKPLAILYFAVSLYNLWTLQKVNVIYFETVSSGEYVIAVDHLPLTDRDKISWFNDNKKMLESRYFISMNNFNRITIMEAVGGIKNINSHWVDDYYCFSRVESDFRCVDKNLQVNIERAQDGVLIFYIHTFGGIYVQAMDGGIKKINYENYFDDLDDRLGESLNRLFFR